MKGISFKLKWISLSLGLCILFSAVVIKAPLPFGLALLLAEKYEKTFFLSKEQIASEYTVFDQLVLGLLELKFRYDWKNFIVRENKNKIKKDLDAIELILEKVNFFMINQKDIYHQPVDQSTFFAALRGYGWCDQVNSIFTYAITGLVDESELFALFDKKRNRSTHTVSRIHSKQLGVLFVDVWMQENQYFSFTDLLTEEGKKVVPIYSGLKNSNQFEKLPKKYYLDGYILNKYSFWYQLRKVFLRVSKIITTISFKKSLLVSTAYAGAQKKKETDLGTRKQRIVYISARIHHLYGELENAKELYKQVMGCKTDFCKASAIYFSRLERDGQKK